MMDVTMSAPGSPNALEAVNSAPCVPRRLLLPTSIFWERTECKAELYTGSTFVLNPRRSSSFCLRGASLAGNSAACALGATRRSPLPLSVAYFPGALVTRMST